MGRAFGEAARRDYPCRGPLGARLVWHGPDVSLPRHAGASPARRLWGKGLPSPLPSPRGRSGSYSSRQRWAEREARSLSLWERVRVRVVLLRAGEAPGGAEPHPLATDSCRLRRPGRFRTQPLSCEEKGAGDVSVSACHAPSRVKLSAPEPRGKGGRTKERPDPSGCRQTNHRHRHTHDAITDA